MVKRVLLEPLMCQACRKSSGGFSCYGCSKKLCAKRECSIELYSDPFSDFVYGDYPLVCHKCYKKLENIKDKLEAIHQKHQEELEVEEEKWHKCCKEH